MNLTRSASRRLQSNYAKAGTLDWQRSAGNEVDFPQSRVLSLVTKDDYTVVFSYDSTLQRLELSVVNEDKDFQSTSLLSIPTTAHQITEVKKFLVSVGIRTLPKTGDFVWMLNGK